MNHNVLYQGNHIWFDNKEMCMNDLGYFLPSTSKFYFYVKDHQGNNRVVIDQSGTVVQKNAYYPYGLPMENRFGSDPVNADVNNQPFKYNGKELDLMHGMILYDYGSRLMDPTFPRFLTIDPLCELDYGVSPYAYCANNFVNAIDLDGRLVIFINGMHNGFEGARPAYWSMKGEKPIGFNTAVLAHFEDWNDKYYDGSIGGSVGLLNGNMSPFKRSEFGYLTGEIDAASIVASLARDNNGKITESIKVITHSMGAAYAKGFARALIEYAKKNSGLCFGLSITEYDFAPFQPTSQKAVKGVHTFQYSHRYDRVADYAKIPGAEFMDTSSDEDKTHPISTFYDQIKNLPGGKYEFKNGEFVRID